MAIRRRRRTSRSHRVFRAIGARSVSADDGVVLVACPIWPGETVKWIRIDAVSLAGSASAYKLAELNWRGLIVPSADIGVGGMDLTAGLESDADFTTTIDTTFKRYTMQPEALANQVYGGDVNLEASEEEAIPGYADMARFRRRGNIDDWFRREILMRPYGNTGTAYLQSDMFNTLVSKNMHRRIPSFLLFGALRFEHEADTNFNWENVQSFTSQSASFGIHSMIWDPEFVEANLEDFPRLTAPTAVEGPQGGAMLAQVLRGDNYVEADRMEDSAAYTFTKVQIGIDTPIRASVIGT